MLIVGINAYHGDASAAAIVDGKLVAAAEEERFTRIKHAAGFPVEALKYVLKATGASSREIDLLAVARDPWARIMRKAWHALKMPLVARDRRSALWERERARYRSAASSIIARTWRARSWFRRSTRPPCSRSTGWATLPVR